MGAAGKTPFGAGRMTPGRMTGVTPGYGTAYGKTPNPYALGATKTPSASLPAPLGSFTPNPTQFGMTPWQPPVQHGATPLSGYSGMNPDRARMIQEANSGWATTPRR